MIFHQCMHLIVGCIIWNLYKRRITLTCEVNFFSAVFRFLDKAAILEGRQGSVDKPNNPWKLTTVTKVEETKLILKTIPIWLTSLTFGICQAQVSTFFIKQSATMNRNITHSFVIPPASLWPECHWSNRFSHYL